MAQNRGGNSGVVEMLRFVLITLGVLMVIASAVGALASVPGRGDTVSFTQALAVAGGVLALGMALGALLFGLAGVVSLLAVRVQQGRQQQAGLEKLHGSILQLEETLRNMPAVAGTHVPASEVAPAATTVANSGASFPAGLAPAEIVELLEQLRDLFLMSESQRAQWAARHWGKRTAFLTSLIERGINQGDWAQVQTRMEELRAVAAGNPDVTRLEEQIAREQTARLQGDVAAAQNQVRHFMSISAWPQAEEVALGMQKKYPQAAEAQQMAAEVQRERQAFEQENAGRLFMDLSDATEHRQWRRALQVAEEILRRYPMDRRVEKLQHDVLTIRDNAGAQERKEQEELFKDLLKRQRYEEAREVAASVIEKFPNSPAAVELTKLMPKVEELIRQERAKRQQAGAV